MGGIIVDRPMPPSPSSSYSKRPSPVDTPAKLYPNNGGSSLSLDGDDARDSHGEGDELSRFRFGYGFSTDGSWVTWRGRNLLWLPAEFRPVCSAVCGSAVVIGCSSGRVIVIGFSPEKHPTHDHFHSRRQGNKIQ